MNELRAVALRERRPDLVVQNGRVFHPETETFERGSLLVCGDRIAGVTADEVELGPRTAVVDAEGGTVLPGFIDAHTHLDTLQVFEQSYTHALTGGTTTVVTECDRFAARFGAAGVEAMLTATADLPVDVYVSLPPGPFLEDIAGVDQPDIDQSQLLELADVDRVVGVGEMFWNHVVLDGGQNPVWALLEAVVERGKVVSGHGAGCRDEKLSAFATIVDNDHEILAGEDVPERVKRGITAIGRYGSIRDDMAAFVAGVDDLPDGVACLCSDGMWPRELLAEGYMDEVVRRAIAAGLEPARAFRMATLNAADHFGLDDRGSLAPGSVADVIVVSDVRLVDVDTVISGGEIVVEDGAAGVESRPFEYPPEFTDCVHVDIPDDRFDVVAADTGEVRAIEFAGQLLSTETQVTPPVEDGLFVAAPRDGLNKAAVLPVDPAQNDGGFTGFLTGLGLREGAVATSDPWTHPGVVVIGADSEEMTAAARRVADIGGGWVVVHDGDVVAEFPTPVAGVCAATPVETSLDRLQAIRSALEAQGVSTPQPLVAIGTVAAIGMPWLKLASTGYVDTAENELVGL